MYFSSPNQFKIYFFLKGLFFYPFLTNLLTFKSGKDKNFSDICNDLENGRLFLRSGFLELYGRNAMKFNKHPFVLLSALLIFFATALCAQDTEDTGRLDAYQDELDERDWEVIREYLRFRREVEKEKTKSALLLSGDIRSEWQHNVEAVDGINLFGSDVVDRNGIRRGNNVFKVQSNFRLDYDVESSWAVFQLNYNNKAGIDDELNCSDFNSKGERICYCRELQGSGNCGNICVKQAFFGYNLYKCKETEFDIEIGRRNLYHVFDSKVQFLSRFDGIVLSLNSSVKDLFEYYIYTAGFVVDFKSNHFSWITETGFLDIYESGLDLKYSFIDWNKNGHNRCSGRVPICLKDKDKCEKDGECVKPGDPLICCGRKPPGTRFMVSQWTAAYAIKKEKTRLNEPIKVFGAFLINHDNPVPCLGSRFNKAWYAGFTIGDLRKEEDWSFGVQYQWVEAFSVPDLDMAGIGNGNVLDDLIITDGIGNTNFKGWRFNGAYLLTDDITIEARYQWSTEISKKFGGPHYYNQFKVEMLYAF